MLANNNTCVVVVLLGTIRRTRRTDVGLEGVHSGNGDGLGCEVAASLILEAEAFGAIRTFGHVCRASFAETPSGPVCSRKGLVHMKMWV